MTSVRALMQIACQEDLIVHQMDVKTAYLNAPIDCEIYVEQPQGYTVSGKNGEKLVWRLKKSLYGLKQSGRNWNNLLHSHLIEDGFSQSPADPCVYTRHAKDEKTVMIVWVDDIIIASNKQSTLNSVKEYLSQRYQMKDLGEISWFLGIQFSREATSYKMNQSKYIENILARFQMSDCKPRSTPCEMSGKPMVEDTEPTDAKRYREIVGSLIYVMTTTRPDVCYAVTKLAQHMANPFKVHETMAKHVLRYLKGTIDKELVFCKHTEQNMRLLGYCDADWGNADDRRSITGYCFQLAYGGAAISWKSRKQPTVALSTCEAEYMALASATQEAKFLMQLLTDMSGNVYKNFDLHCDSQSAIALAKNPVQHQRSKHIDIKYHLVRNEVQSGTMELLYTPSDQNVADISPSQ